MKTDYSSPGDRDILYKIMRRALMSTEVLYDLATSGLQLDEYVKQLAYIRAKIFEYLEEKDPNPNYHGLLSNR